MAKRTGLRNSLSGTGRGGRKSSTVRGDAAGAAGEPVQIQPDEAEPPGVEEAGASLAPPEQAAAIAQAGPADPAQPPPPGDEYPAPTAPAPTVQVIVPILLSVDSVSESDSLPQGEETAPSFASSEAGKGMNSESVEGFSDLSDVLPPFPPVADLIIAPAHSADVPPADEQPAPPAEVIIPILLSVDSTPLPEADPPGEEPVRMPENGAPPPEPSPQAAPGPGEVPPVRNASTVAPQEGFVVGVSAFGGAVLGALLAGPGALALLGLGAGLALGTRLSSWRASR